MTDQQPTALRLADEIERKEYPPRRAAAAELRRLHRYEVALKEWCDKTEWVQVTCRVDELGMHRADVLKARIAALEKALGMAVEALEQVYLNTYDDSAEKVARDAADAARQALGGAA